MYSSATFGIFKGNGILINVVSIELFNTLNSNFDDENKTSIDVIAVANKTFINKNHSKNHTKKRHENDKQYVERLRAGHKKYRENGGNEKSRENILRLMSIGKIKTGRNNCAIEGCNSFSDAKGLCEKHYQRMRRLKEKAAREGMVARYSISRPSMVM